MVKSRLLTTQSGHSITKSHIVKMDYNNSKIEPGKGIGPFIIGMTESELFNLIPTNNPKRKVGNLYTTEFDSITFWVDSTTRKIVQIGVSGNFSGKLFDLIHLGNSVKNIEDAVGTLKIDEEYQLKIDGLAGICFHTIPPINDLNPMLYYDAVIDGIYVFSE